MSARFKKEIDLKKSVLLAFTHSLPKGRSAGVASFAPKVVMNDALLQEQRTVIARSPWLHKGSLCDFKLSGTEEVKVARTAMHTLMAAYSPPAEEIWHHVYCTLPLKRLDFFDITETGPRTDYKTWRKFIALFDTNIGDSVLPLKAWYGIVIDLGLTITAGFVHGTWEVSEENDTAIFKIDKGINTFEERYIEKLSIFGIVRLVPHTIRLSFQVNSGLYEYSIGAQAHPSYTFLEIL